jgi:hypothetical protein
LTEIYAELGRTTKVPNLWVYAENDQYFGTDVPVAWHAAFAAGGSPTTFVHAPPVPDRDGHGLSRHQSALWAQYLNPFVRSLGIRPQHDLRPARTGPLSGDANIDAQTQRSLSREARQRKTGQLLAKLTR